MTRLREEDIYSVSERLSCYDRQLGASTGTGLAGIAAQALGKVPADFARLQAMTTIGVIPIAYGQGIINGFSETVADIVRLLGFSAFVTQENNIGGLAEAVAKGAQVVFLADDDTFVAINIVSGKVSDNGEATGRGYAAALGLMAGGLTDQTVLLIGAGPVGTGAALYLAANGAKILAYDQKDSQVARLQQQVPGVTAVPELSTALTQCSLVLEATPAADTIAPEYITPASRIAAPGIPLGLNQEGRSRLGGHLVHDVLEIGVATMLFTVLAE